jgi:hypothetical protein
LGKGLGTLHVTQGDTQIEPSGSRGLTRKSRSTTVPQLVKAPHSRQRSALRLPLLSHPRDVVADFVVACVVAHCSERYHVLRTVGDDLVEGLCPQQKLWKGFESKKSLETHSLA